MHMPASLHMGETGQSLFSCYYASPPPKTHICFCYLRRGEEYGEDRPGMLQVWKMGYDQRGLKGQ